MKKILFKLSVFALSLLFSCQTAPPPAPLETVPSKAQLAWHEMEKYAFVHFSMNTFTDKEWGYGDDDPDKFNPTQLDCRQWARVCKENGFQGIILTAKHHDGFCLWPTKTTEYSVKNSQWKGGQGDVVRELREACDEYGLKMGLYLSPWDRNSKHYGTPEYIAIYKEQAKELLTQYGTLFEFWVDGANGGDGYYGGAKEKRMIDRHTYYQWDKTFKHILSFQPQVIIFSDAGPGCRWIGNEKGFAKPTNWSTLRKGEFYPGGSATDFSAITEGHEDGDAWIPSEVDVSIRPGWYYHPSQDNRVKTVGELVDIYYHSVGRNSTLNLNFPVDRRGLIHENDVKNLSLMTAQLKADFSNELAKGVKVTADQQREGHCYGPSSVNDGDKKSYWTTPEGVTTASLTFHFEKPMSFNRFLVQEYIRLGQRVKEFKVEAEVNGKWKTLAKETTIGYKRILRLPTVKATKVRFSILASKACPVISNIELYDAPKMVKEQE